MYKLDGPFNKWVNFSYVISRMKKEVSDNQVISKQKDKKKREREWQSSQPFNIGRLCMGQVWLNTE